VKLDPETGGQRDWVSGGGVRRFERYDLWGGGGGGGALGHDEVGSASLEEKGKNR